MTLGIRNPFDTGPKKKKQPLKTVYDGINTESPKKVPPVVSLDGGRYVVNVNNAASAKDAAIVLLRFFHALEGSDVIRAQDLGVSCVPPEIDVPKESCLLLRHEGMSILVYVGDDKSPEAAYRRIAYVLLGLSKLELQKEHGITVIERM
jgi:hypothetical protein